MALDDNILSQIPILYREIGILRTEMGQRFSTAAELSDAKANGNLATLTTRLDGMDTALELVQAITDKLPSAMDSAIEQLQRLNDERFRSVSLQFAERDTRNDQRVADSKSAVEKALTMAKESVTDQFNDLKNRVMGMESNMARTTMVADLKAVFLDRFAIVEKGTDLARDSIEKQFAGVNEFRAQLRDQNNTFITRDAVTSAIEGLADRQRATENRISNYDGRMMVIGIVAAAIPTVMMLIFHFATGK